MLSMNQMRPLKKFAEDNKIGYRTAYRYWQNGFLEGIKLPNGTILIKDWKHNDATQDTDAKSIIILRKDSATMKQELLDMAHMQGFKNIDIKIWNGKLYESNILVKDVVDSGYTTFFVYSIQDAFGANYRNVAFLLEKSGIKIIALKETSLPVEDTINTLLSAVSKMLRAAVGMHSYKKEISDIINKLIS